MIAFYLLSFLALGTLFAKRHLYHFTCVEYQSVIGFLRWRVCGAFFHLLAEAILGWKRSCFKH
jgi:hypothetical protein